MPEEGMIEVTGGKVWYQIHNQHANGVPLVILHGGPGSSCFSLQGLKALAKDRPVIMYDQLGCGRSDRPEDPSLWRIDRFVEELAMIRNALGLKDVHILGHSWGTTLAAAYCLTSPEGVASVIFSSPCLSAPLWEKDQKQNLKKLPEEVQETISKCEAEGKTDSPEYRDAVEVFNKHFVCRLDPFPKQFKAGPELKNEEIYNTMWGPSEFHVTGNLREFNCTPRLNEITVPTLFTCGRFDEATPETTRYYSSLAPDSRFHVFEKSAHMPYIEEQEEYMEVAEKFLCSVES